MIFAALYESYQLDELIMIDGGFCRYHLRKDGWITIHEIFSKRPGAGQEILDRLDRIPDSYGIVARCPLHMKASNEWYKRRGFTAVRETLTRAGNRIVEWQRTNKTSR